MKDIIIPALRANLGDWVYYSATIPLDLLSELVDFADTLHKSKELSKLIQREIKRKRGVEISDYLIREKEHFFNSLVVAVYGGIPSWHSIEITSSHSTISKDNLTESQLDSFGFLRFTGEESLFAVDGQHRLAGIKKAVDSGHKFIDEEVSVLFVAHQNTDSGIQRTRRLFTTLNKTAVKVSKGEIIALDENDVMAIIVRRLVENNDFFMDNKIAYKQTNNISPKDKESLTTIGNLYDLLKVLFVAKSESPKLSDLQSIRPHDSTLDEYYNYACSYFSLLGKNFTQLNDFFNSTNPADVIKRYRGNFGGNILFRPIGLQVMTEVICILQKRDTLKGAVERVSTLPTSLDEIPYKNVLWNPLTETVISKGRVLARDLLLFILGEKFSAEKLKSLKMRYAKFLEVEVNAVELPKKL